LYWLLLAVAIVSEVAATTLLKSTEGFTRLWPSVIVICLYELSFILLTITVRKIAVSVVYATWGGIGVALVTVVAWVWLGQALDAAALVGIGLIVAGVVVMQGFSRTTHA
jgi:small multidrug resistance pump